MDETQREPMRQAAAAGNNATFPYVPANPQGSPADGVNTYQGKLTYKAVADSQQRLWTPITDLI